MRIVICSDYYEMSSHASRLIASQILLKPTSVLGLATGSTPLGTYKNLVKMNKSGEISFKDITTFNLDEYYPISPSNPQSYRYYMNENLFNHIDIDINNTFIPDGQTAAPDIECYEYEEKIRLHGGIDLQILGIGQNGHIGFNEPDENLNTLTHVTDLTESTIKANSRFFESEAEVPTKALTMGISSILKSQKIILLASGKSKHAVVAELLTNDINTNIPATLLKVHPDVVIVCDKDAYEG